MVVLHIMFLLRTKAFFEASLTACPALVAIALNTGMAVDATCSSTSASARSYARKVAACRSRAGLPRGAFSSILRLADTELIAGIVLFQYGTGPIKGFAITADLGICTSLFTGVFLPRAWLRLARGAELRVHHLRVG